MHAILEGFDWYSRRDYNHILYNLGVTPVTTYNSSCY
jgi:hypothetical protein